MGCDKDGILAGILLLEMASRRPLSERLRELERQHGRFAGAREAWPATAAC